MELTNRNDPHMTHAIAVEKTAEALFEEGLYHFHQAQLSRALELLQSAARKFRERGDFNSFIECLTHIMRILAEQEKTQEIATLEREILYLLTTSDLALKTQARAYYILGVCASFSDVPLAAEGAVFFFQKAIEVAMGGEPQALAYPLYGMAFWEYSFKRFAEAEKHLSKLDVLLESQPVLDLQISASLLRGLIAQHRKQYESALEHVWSAYGRIRGAPRIGLYIHAVHALGSIYLQKGEIPSAAIYLRLASEAVEKTELPRFARLVDRTLAQLRTAQGPSGIEFDSKQDVLFSPNGKSVSFAGQNILRRLFVLLVEANGSVITKEKIAQEVWSEPYDTDVHDNKIYVTVRRLRTLLAPVHPLGTGVIRRADGGYVMDANIKIEITGISLGRGT